MRSRAGFLTISLALSLLAAGCAEIVLIGDDVRIRVRNTGTVDLTGVAIGFATPTHAFGDVTAGRATGYVEFDHAYRYGYVEAYSGGQRLVIQPVDFVGETKLPGGDYTFELAVDPSGQHLTQKLVRD